MKPVVQVFQVDQCKHSFGHNSLGLKRIITKFGQLTSLVKNFCMQSWLIRNIVTIATNAEVYNMLFCPIEGKFAWLFFGWFFKYIIMLFCPIEGKFGRFFLHSEKKFYKFGCYGVLQWRHDYLGNSKW